MASPSRRQFGIAFSGFLIILGLLGTLTLQAGAVAPAFYARAYVEGIVGVPRDLNPLLQSANGSASEADLTALLFDGLTRPGPDGIPRPELAERWQINPDGRVYTFTLRSGLRWHDGMPLTTADIAFTVRSVQNPAFTLEAGVEELWRTVKVEPLDDRRVRFTLPAPFAPFLAATSLPILPAHLLENVPPGEWAEAPFNRRPVGSGPFRLYSLDDEQAMLVPFEGAARGRPSLDLLVLRFYPSAETAREALRRREIQGLAAVSGASLVGGTATVDLPLAAYTMLLFNVRQAPLDDARLRAALTQGLDRSRLVGGVEEGARLLDSPMLPQTPFHGLAALPPFAPGAAEQALDTLGWRRNGGASRARGSIPLRLPLVCANTPSALGVAHEIARQVSALGVDVPVEAVDPAELSSRLARHDFALAIHSWRLPNGDPDVFGLWHSSQGGSGANYTGIDDPELDELLVEGRATSGIGGRAGLYRAAEERWIELLPAVPLYQHILHYELDPAVRTAGIEPTALLVRPSDRFRGISAWTTSP